MSASSVTLDIVCLPHECRPTLQAFCIQHRLRCQHPLHTLHVHVHVARHATRKAQYIRFMWSISLISVHLIRGANVDTAISKEEGWYCKRYMACAITLVTFGLIIMTSQQIWTEGRALVYIIFEFQHRPLFLLVTVPESQGLWGQCRDKVSIPDCPAVTSPSCSLDGKTYHLLLLPPRLVESAAAC